MKRRLIFIPIAIFCLLSAEQGFGQDAPPTRSVPDSATSAPIYFPVGRAVLEKDYLDNAGALRGLDSIMANPVVLSGLDSIRVTGMSSPEGNAAINQRLALQRAVAVTDYLTANFPSIDRSRIRAEWSTASWEALRHRIVTDRNVPYRTEVLGIIGSGISPQEMNAQLRRAGNGGAWSYLANNYLKYMRYDEIQVLYHKEEPLPVDPAQVVPAPVRDTVTVIREVIAYQTVALPPAEEYVRKPLFALKTNLLFDAATALNLEVEIPIRDHWSIAAEYIFPWWLWKKSQIAFQTLSGSIEGRYWFGDRTMRPQLTGWFLGLYVGGGYYDVEWRRKGYQGKFIAPGISAGYAHKISRNLSMEYSIGLGVIRTKYTQYKAVEQNDGWCLQRVDSGHGTWIGPTKVKISLVWMINHKTKNRDAR